MNSFCDFFFCFVCPLTIFGCGFVVGLCVADDDSPNNTPDQPKSPANDAQQDGGAK
jgi:hypothetical protein